MIESFVERDFLFFNSESERSKRCLNVINETIVNFDKFTVSPKYCLMAKRLLS